MKIHRFALFYILIATSVLFSCNKENNIPEKAVAATLYDYTGLDGCTWIVDLEDNNGICEIAGFPNNGFNMEDGKKVWVTYDFAENQISICMVGPRVDITGIWEK